MSALPQKRAVIEEVAVARDPHAEFSAFAVAASHRLLRTAKLLTGDPHLAQDLVQTALLKVFLHWGRSSQWESPEAYAQRVLYTTFCAWRGRRWVGEVPTAVLPEAGRGDDHAAHSTGAVHQALLALPRRQRAVLVARYYDDLSVEQAAVSLGCSTGTVKSQTARALARLRDVLTVDHVLEES